MSKIYGIMEKTSICYGHGDFRQDWVFHHQPFFNSRGEAETFNTAGKWALGKVVECELVDTILGIKFFSPSLECLMMMNPNGVWVHKNEISRTLSDLMRENTELKKKLEHMAITTTGKWSNSDQPW